MPHSLSLSKPKNRLQELPQELRDMIYGYAVTSPSPIASRIHLRDVEVLSSGTDSDASDTTTEIKISPPQPPLSMVDRSTRTATLRLFYTENTFLFRMHNLDLSPLRTWLRATNDGYTDDRHLIRHVAIERSVLKTCAQSPTRSKHTYRIRIDSRTGSADLQVRFEGDLANECACALQSAARIRPTRPLTMGLYVRSAAMSFAADVEDDFFSCLGGLGSECTFVSGLCRRAGGEPTKCETCGMDVTGRDDEPIGSRLLSMYKLLAAAKRAREAEEAARLGM